MKIIIDENSTITGGNVRLKAVIDGKYIKSSFIDKVNEKLDDYWVLTGRERNIKEVVFEVLAEDYDKRNNIISDPSEDNK